MPSEVWSCKPPSRSAWWCLHICHGMTAVELLAVSYIQGDSMYGEDDDLSISGSLAQLLQWQWAIA